MTNLSLSRFVKCALEESPCVILYTLEGKWVRTLEPKPRWNGDDEILHGIVQQAIAHHAPVYRYTSLTQLLGGKVNVLVYAVALAMGECSENVIVYITPMACIERYLHQSELLDAAIEMIDEAILITDANNRIVSLNVAFKKLTGYTLDELSGKTPQFLSGGITSAHIYQEMWHRLLTTGRWEGEVWDRRKDGTIYSKWLNATVIRDEQGTIVNYIGVFSDTSESKETDKVIDTLSHYDALTQLPNRRYLGEHLSFLTAAITIKHQKIGLLLIDLDRFKLVNDSLGYTAGDRLLLEMAERIRKTVRKNDVVGRLGGDEFLVVLPMVQDSSDAIEVAEKIIEAMKAPFVLDATELYTSASIGISFFPTDGESVDAVIQHAEQAMYAAKKRGGRGYELFISSLNETTLRRLMIENEMQRGIGNGEFRLLYQPQIDPKSGKILAVEALARWEHPTKGTISPVEFIPIAEETGMILELGKWVLHEALRTLKEWLDAGLEPIRMAINVSARQFAHPDFVSLVINAVKHHAVPPHLVELEVTESAVMEEPLRAIQICDELRKRGIEFAIDDFGTGYSSLAYLKLFPVSRLKIDKTFIDDIGKDSQSATLAEVIMVLANTLKLEVIAEGVESKEQLEFLTERGCDLIQGFYYSPPRDAKTIVSYLKENTFTSN